jgi:SAM-dependent methyltransferase
MSASILGAETPSEEVFATFERIFELDAATGSRMRAFLGHGPERDAIRRMVQYTLDITSLSNRPLEGQRVLDAGCGYGLFLVVCGFYGAESLHGVDMDPTPIEFSRAYRGTLPPSLADRLHLELGDVDHLPYEDHSFDLVTAIEAVSHYLELDRALAELARVLRPGGTLVISDGNNGLNRRYAREIHELWQASEDGPGYRAIGGYEVGKPYRERREEIIRERGPGLSDADAHRLATATTGYVREQILDAVDAFERTGVEPTPRRRPDEVPVDPDGATTERLFDPFELGRLLERSGFEDVAVKGYWGGANGRTAVRLANAALAAASRLTMPTARAFRIRATRSLREP